MRPKSRQPTIAGILCSNVELTWVSSNSSSSWWSTTAKALSYSTMMVLLVESVDGGQCPTVGRKREGQEHYPPRRKAPWESAGKQPLPIWRVPLRMRAPNGLELSCPAEAGKPPVILAHNCGPGAPPCGPARRVSFSELLGGIVRAVSETASSRPGARAR
jgi:hypothetical protein